MNRTKSLIKSIISMINNPPERFSKKWFLVFIKTSLVYSAIMFISLVFASVLAWGGVFEANMIFFLFFAIKANLIVCAFGFFGGKYIFKLATIPLFISTIIGSFTITTDKNGWEYLAGIMILELYTGFGIIVGIIVQLKDFIKNRKESREAQDEIEQDTLREENMLVEDKEGTSKEKKTGRILLQLYIVLLCIPMVLILINGLEPSVNKYDDMEAPPPEIDFYSIKYTEGSAEYSIELEITQDKELSYTEYYHEMDNEGNIKKKLNSKKNRRISEVEYNDLVDYITYETDFMHLEDDLSTQDNNIHDAPAAFIEIKYDDDVIEKGGYYPFENKAFRNIKNRMFSLVVKEKESLYEQIKNKEHPHESSAFKIAGEFNSQLLSQLHKCQDSYITVEKIKYDEENKEYNIDVEIEVMYTNDWPTILGTINWNLEENVFKFEQKEYEGSFLKKGKLNKAIKNIKEIK